MSDETEESTEIGKLVGQVDAMIEEVLWDSLMTPDDKRTWFRTRATMMEHFRASHGQDSAKQEAARAYFAELSRIMNRPEPNDWDWLRRLGLL